jgi:hypothetical protein
VLGSVVQAASPNQPTNSYTTATACASTNTNTNTGGGGSAGLNASDDRWACVPPSSPYCHDNNNGTRSIPIEAISSAICNGDGSCSRPSLAISHLLRCDCIPSRLGQYCQQSWANDFTISYKLYRFGFLVIFAIIFMAYAWRMIAMHERRRVLQRQGVPPTRLGSYQLTALALYMTQYAFRTLSFIDPLSAEGIYTPMVWTSLHLMGSICQLQGFGVLVRIFVLSHHIFHPHTKPLVKWTILYFIVSYHYKLPSLTSITMIPFLFDDILSVLMMLLVGSSINTMRMVGISIFRASNGSMDINRPIRDHIGYIMVSWYYLFYSNNSTIT